MPTCSNCGATIREGAKFCTSCGTRLNDTSNASSTSVWAVPEPTAEPTATTADPAIDDTLIVDAAQELDAATSGADSAEATAASGGFSWSWGTPVTADTSESGNPPQGDDELGIVHDGNDPSETTSDAIADPTELEILDDQPSPSDEALVDGVADPDSSAVIDDALAGPDDDESATASLPDDERDDTDTLAAWAGEWESSEAAVDVDQDDTVEILDAVAEEEPVLEVETDVIITEDTTVTGVGTETEEIVAEAETANEVEIEEGNEAEELIAETETESEAEIEPVPYAAEPAPLAAKANVPAVTEAEEAGDESDGEDTVARAERLIGELKAIIPTLVRPRPALPAKDNDASLTVADDLDSAARIGQFDDVRDALLAARDNPRDVDNMLRLAGNVDRLLELLDDRNNLAKTATSAAGRLRKATSATEL